MTGIAVYVADMCPPKQNTKRDTHTKARRAQTTKGRAVGKTETQPEGSLTTAATTAGLGQPSLWSRETIR